MSPVRSGSDLGTQRRPRNKSRPWPSNSHSEIDTLTWSSEGNTRFPSCTAFAIASYDASVSSASLQRLWRSSCLATATGIACTCLLYTSDAADDLLCVDLGGRRIIKKKKTH